MHIPAQELGYCPAAIVTALGAMTSSGLDLAGLGQRQRKGAGHAIRQDGGKMRCCSACRWRFSSSACARQRARR